ncbi:MAG: SH3 domain-containing protein [Candidatus Promineifilaceae bacterium]|nr:SH3 domain-containing protein [Candidatus Promineifilaceae bacterium]
MAEEHSKDAAQESSSPETKVSSSAETTVISTGGGDNNMSPRQTKLVVASIVLILILIVAGLFLPPISLGERLGLGGEEQAVGEMSLPGEVVVRMADPTAEVGVTSLDRQTFLAGDVDDEWAAAASAMPSRLSLVSNVYAVTYDGDRASGQAELNVPADAQPLQTLDLYGWNGQAWTFVPSVIVDSEAGHRVVSADGPLPQALALMQAGAPDQPTIAAEVRPAHQLPAQVLPLLTEVSAGTLTLGENGALLGETTAVPEGPYQRLARATNTGVIVDMPSLVALLTTPSAQESHIAALVEAARSGGFDGINLDYQSVPPAQREAFSTFVANLANALHNQGLSLAVTLETPLRNGDVWDTGGQDWAVLGQAADFIYVQLPLRPDAYADAGPAEQVIQWATRQVERSKLTTLISVNAIDAVGDTQRELASEEALANFGELSFASGDQEVDPGATVELALTGTAGALEWDPASLSYKYSYEQAEQPHEVWLTSEAVLNHRSRLGAKYNLRGLLVRGLDELDDGTGYAAALQSYLGAADAPQPASAAIVWTVEDADGGVVASESGATAFSWTAPEAPGVYRVQASFAQGDSVAALDAVEVIVREAATPEPVAEAEATEEAEEAAEPTATPEPEEEEEETEAAAPAAVDPGQADAASTTVVNVRSGPGLGYGIIGSLDTGEKVSLIGRNAERTWLQIRKADETEGWAFAQLLTINSGVDVGALAVVEVDPPVASSGGGGSAPAPVIAPAATGNFELGGQTHTLANPQLMKMAGMNWVKFQHKWGPGDTPNAVAGRIQQAQANGFKVLLSMPGANAYPSSIDFAGYVEFLRGVAALGPDAIEVWNEMNIDFEWPAGQIDPASYVNNMLAPAYNAIKGANPNVMVIMGAPAPTGFDNGTNAWSDSRYMAGVAAAGGANYMDCIGVHHNAGATPPSQTTGHPAGNDHYSWYFGPTLNMYWNALGGARPVCFTELGYLSGQDFGGVPSRFSWAANTSVAQHAQWLAQAVSQAANSGRVRLVIIFNVDFTHWSDDPQAGYAMLRPDGSCPSCALLGQVMGR